MKENIALGLRIILGLNFIVFGFNGFLEFLPFPSMTVEAQKFLIAMAETTYFLPLLKIVEIICGISIFFGLFLPLGLVILTPILLNIFLFHLFLDPSGIPMAVVLIALHSALTWFYWPYFRSVLSFKSSIH